MVIFDWGTECADLSDSVKFPDERPTPHIPHPETLGGDVQQGVAVSIVQCERHDGVILLYEWEVTQLLEVV